MAKPPFQFTLKAVWIVLTIAGVLLAVWIQLPVLVRLLMVAILGTSAIIFWVLVEFALPESDERLFKKPSGEPESYQSKWRARTTIRPERGNGPHPPCADVE